MKKNTVEKNITKVTTFLIKYKTRKTYEKWRKQWFNNKSEKKNHAHTARLKVHEL